MGDGLGVFSYGSTAYSSSTGTWISFTFLSFMSSVIRSLPKPNPQRIMDLGDPLNRYKWTIHNGLFFSLTQPRTVQTVTDHCHDFLHDIGLKDPIASDNSGPAKGENFVTPYPTFFGDMAGHHTFIIDCNG